MAKCARCAGNAALIHVKDSTSFYRCRHCDIIFTGERPLQENLYSESYYKPWGLTDASEPRGRACKMATFQRWLGSLERFGPTGKVLDVGCAAGFFLEAAKERGWVPYGIEISPFASDLAKKKFGGLVFTGTIENAPHAAEFFDSVTFFDVIEHVQSPEHFLRCVARMLKQGGTIALSTVNISSVSCRVLKRLWPHFKPEHVVYFSSKSLRKLLDNAGFETCAWSFACKDLTLAYIAAYFESYPMPVLSFFFRSIVRLLPASIASTPFRIFSGEMFVIARKRESAR